MQPLMHLVKQWRERGSILLPGVEYAQQSCADELEAALRGWAAEMDGRILYPYTHVNSVKREILGVTDEQN